MCSSCQTLSVWCELNRTDHVKWYHELSGRSGQDQSGTGDFKIPKFDSFSSLNRQNDARDLTIAIRDSLELREFIFKVIAGELSVHRASLKNYSDSLTNKGASVDSGVINVLVIQ